MYGRYKEVCKAYWPYSVSTPWEGEGEAETGRGGRGGGLNFKWEIGEKIELKGGG